MATQSDSSLEYSMDRGGWWIIIMVSERVTHDKHTLWASLVAQIVKNLPAMLETLVRFWVGKIPWRKALPPTPVFLPGESPRIEVPGGL